jgi:hypothetical protein
MKPEGKHHAGCALSNEFYYEAKRAERLSEAFKLNQVRETS